MPHHLAQIPFHGSLADHLALVTHNKPSLYWLGQAGFLLRYAERSILIDPYLSNGLEKKYRETALPHDRLMAAPITVDQLGKIDLVLCTHHHTDHMDPGTLTPLAKSNADLKFVVPAASLEEAQRRIEVTPSRLIGAEANNAIHPLEGLVVKPTRAAHEELTVDTFGQHKFLGYQLEFAGLRVFHSGDCVPFSGQEEEVTNLNADLALLPVNGRSQWLSDQGIAGNMNVDEARALCVACGIPSFIAHHYGMFGFNSVAPSVIDTPSAWDSKVQTIRALTQIEYQLGAKDSSEPN